MSAVSAVIAVMAGVVAAAIIAGLLVRHHHRRNADARELASTLASHVRAWRRFCDVDRADRIDSLSDAPDATQLRHASALQARSFPALHSRMRMVVLLHGMMSRALFVTDSRPMRQDTLGTLCKQLEWEVDLLLDEMHWPALSSVRTRAPQPPLQQPLQPPKPRASSGKGPDPLLHNLADELQSPLVRFSGGSSR